jgi:outer membrane lipoprotein-sorting protein
MKKLLLLSIIILSQLFSASAQKKSAEKVVNDLITTIKTSVIEANFKLTIEFQGETNTINGKIVLKNNKFFADMSEFMVWYNGKTQWSYMLNTNEVSIIEPDENEVASINPLLLLKTVNENSSKQFDKSSSTKNQTIIIKPKKNQGNFTSIALTLDKATNSLVSIVINSKDKSITKIEITNFKKDVKYQDTYFTFDIKKYKGVYVNDLR